MTWQQLLNEGRIDKCRRKRNIADYDMANSITEAETAEMLKVANSFSKKAEEWIRNNYPSFG